MTGDPDEISVDDIKAVRAEGRAELRALMRAQIDIGRARRTPPERQAAPSPPGHRPGAWPTGSSPPGPPPEWSYPKAAWDAAVRHYRNTQHFPDQPCDCGNCPVDNPEETR
ncbi:hypothetical protein ACH49_12150 [Streptomyces leeuwenhoekii]|uniref:Uncharacterized protein n=1 Tax=Streptomyces leeuwenhoekii TaxID=1437453 RepID=A0ABR5HZX4_STRLW|nr:hypothetical protein [Streptomyces leeuwenhoekii]KMS79572.1 hypothetical protein ACH49_12150 [Streptomyces leeuwenhoekii]